MMPLDPPFAAMLWKVRPLAPMVVLLTLSAVPVLLLIVFGLAPVWTLVVPRLEALKPVPEVVSMSSPPLVKFTVVPAELLLRVTAVLPAVLSVLVPPLKVNVGLLVELETLIPLDRPVDERLPDR